MGVSEGRLIPSHARRCVNALTGAADSDDGSGGRPSGAFRDGNAFRIDRFRELADRAAKDRMHNLQRDFGERQKDERARCDAGMWDGEFAGSIGFRWRPGTTDLPPYCLGHIGYGVVPWKQRRGYATRALANLLPLAKQEGLPFVAITTDTHNVPSQRVILANGGVFV